MNCANQWEQRTNESIGPMRNVKSHKSPPFLLLLIFLDNVVNWFEMTCTWLVRMSTGDCLLPARDIEKIPSSTFTINIHSSSNTCVTLLNVVFSPREMLSINHYKSIKIILIFHVCQFLIEKIKTFQELMTKINYF